MKLPDSLLNKKEWILVGPMGPALTLSRQNLPIMTIDGGALHTSKSEVWVGDGDSFPHGTPSDLVFKLPVHKDKSDLASGLELLDKSSCRMIHAWGFQGGRKDHELFVLGEFHYFLKMNPGCEIFVYSQQGNVSLHFLSQGSWKMNSLGLFSLGCVEETKVTLTGVIDYPLREERTLPPLSSLGLSNRSQGDFTLRTTGPAFVVYPEAP